MIFVWQEKKGRDDKIRTCDPTPPRRVRYRAALHPELMFAKVSHQTTQSKNPILAHQNFYKPNEGFT